MGLSIAPFRISTPAELPPSPQHGLVTKAISTDERIDANRYLTTMLVSEAKLVEIEGAHLATPCLLQHRIQPRTELRVFFILGETIALALRPSPEHIDIRYSSAEEMAPRFVAVPPELGSSLRDFARTQQLNFCAFDILETDGGRQFLVDVTPNGSWDYFENAEAPRISEALAQAVTSHIAAKRES